MRVHDIIAEPIRNFGLCQSEQEIEERVAKLLEKVRLLKLLGNT
jgi:ABC-type oligopeptide transport system ATPase subunit